MRSERRHSLLVLCQPLIHVVAGGDLEVREWVHVMKIHIAIEVVAGQLSKVDHANRVLDVGPFQGVSHLCSYDGSECDPVKTSHIFSFFLFT